MNERIRELAEQARKYAWENETHWSAGPERERLFEQKFAELIVRECANIANNKMKLLVDSIICEEKIDSEVFVGNKIKQHFGVEE